MILLDANILLYAYIEELPQHLRISRWLEQLLSDQAEATGIAWIAAMAFLRISTNKRIFGKPWTIREASDRLDELFAHPMIQVVNPTENHWVVYSKILTEMNLAGDLVMDAHIAALAVEHKASVASADRDFRRFTDYVKVIDP